MKTTKQLGIWMDHANAHLIRITPDGIEDELTSSKVAQQKDGSENHSEHLLHNKEQQDQKAFYNELGEVIRNYDSVILFGPTEAKAELLNHLRRDHLFEKIKIEVQSTGKMTENERASFVKDYFSKS